MGERPGAGPERFSAVPEDQGTAAARPHSRGKIVVSNGDDPLYARRQDEP